MWQHLKFDRVKYMCATCKHSGRITGYSGRGKTRRMRLWCEQRQEDVSQEFLCDSYTDELGEKLYKGV